MPNVTSPRALSAILDSLRSFAECHHAQYGSPISEDYVLREYWLDILRGLRGMLNSDTGNLDCGQFDSLCCELARNNGFDDSEI